MATAPPQPPSHLAEDDVLRSAFVEMLFALAVSQVAIYVADLVGIAGTLENKLPAIAHLSVGLVLIAASWVGWRQSVSPGMKDKVTFVCSLPFVGLLLDVLLVVLYFVVVRTVEIEQTSEGMMLANPTAEPESFWACIVFGVYIAWDLVADVFSAGCIPRGTHQFRVFKLLRLAFASVFTSLTCCILSFVTYRIATATTDCTEVLFLDGMLIVVILFFRVLKAFENKLARVLRVTDCKAFSNPRVTQGSELLHGTILALLFAISAWGAFSFDLCALVNSVSFRLPCL